MRGKFFDERRGFNRMSIDTAATLQAEDGTVYQAKARDLSATGLSVVMAESLEEGARLSLSICPEQALVPPLDALVEVVRVGGDGQRGYDIGLRIVEIKPAAV